MNKENRENIIGRFAKGSRGVVAIAVTVCMIVAAFPFIKGEFASADNLPENISNDTSINGGVLVYNTTVAEGKTLTVKGTLDVGKYTLTLKSGATLNGSGKIKIGDGGAIVIENKPNEDAEKKDINIDGLKFEGASTGEAVIQSYKDGYNVKLSNLTISNINIPNGVIVGVTGKSDVYLDNVTISNNTIADPADDDQNDGTFGGAIYMIQSVSKCYLSGNTVISDNKTATGKLVNVNLQDGAVGVITDNLSTTGSAIGIYNGSFSRADGATIDCRAFQKPTNSRNSFTSDDSANSGIKATTTGIEILKKKIINVAFTGDGAASFVLKDADGTVINKVPVENSDDSVYKALPGAVVKLEVTPGPTTFLKTATATRENGGNIDLTQDISNDNHKWLYHFTMPEDDVSIAATFEKAIVAVKVNFTTIKPEETKTSDAIASAGVDPFFAEDTSPSTTAKVTIDSPAVFKGKQSEQGTAWNDLKDGDKFAYRTTYQFEAVIKATGGSQFSTAANGVAVTVTGLPGLPNDGITVADIEIVDHTTVKIKNIQFKTAKKPIGTAVTDGNLIVNHTNVGIDSPITYDGNPHPVSVKITDELYKDNSPGTSSVTYSYFGGPEQTLSQTNNGETLSLSDDRAEHGTGGEKNVNIKIENDNYEGVYTTTARINILSVEVDPIVDISNVEARPYDKTTDVPNAADAVTVTLKAKSGNKTFNIDKADYKHDNPEYENANVEANKKILVNNIKLNDTIKNDFAFGGGATTVNKTAVGGKLITKVTPAGIVKFGQIAFPANGDAPKLMDAIKTLKPAQTDNRFTDLFAHKIDSSNNGVQGKITFVKNQNASMTDGVCDPADLYSDGELETVSIVKEQADYKWIFVPNDNANYNCVLAQEGKELWPRAPIAEIVLTGPKEPVKGEAPINTVKFDVNTGIIPAGSAVIIDKVEWIENGRAMQTGDKFKYNRTYTLKITLKAQNGDYFATKGNNSGDEFKAAIGSKTAIVNCQPGTDGSTAKPREAIVSFVYEVGPGTLKNDDLTVINYEGDYDGKPHEVGANCDIEGAVIEYSTTNKDNLDSYSTSPAKYINVSRDNNGDVTSKTVYVMLWHPDYGGREKAIFKEGTVKIRPLQITASISGEVKKKYDTTTYANPQGIKIDFNLNGGGAVPEDAKPSNAIQSAEFGDADVGNNKLVTVRLNQSALNNNYDMDTAVVKAGYTLSGNIGKIEKATPTITPQFNPVTQNSSTKLGEVIAAIGSWGSLNPEREVLPQNIKPAGTIHIDGDFSFANPDESIKKNRTYTWKFTPKGNDAKNYNETTGEHKPWDTPPIESVTIDGVEKPIENMSPITKDNLTISSVLPGSIDKGNVTVANVTWHEKKYNRKTGATIVEELGSSEKFGYNRDYIAKIELVAKEDEVFKRLPNPISIKLQNAVGTIDDGPNVDKELVPGTTDEYMYNKADVSFIFGTTNKGGKPNEDWLKPELPQGELIYGTPYKIEADTSEIPRDDKELGKIKEEYSTDGGITWTPDVPELEDAGEHTVMIKLTHDEYNEPLITRASITIAPLRITPIIVKKFEKEYDGNNQIPESSVPDGAITFEGAKDTIPKSDYVATFWFNSEEVGDDKAILVKGLELKGKYKTNYELVGQNNVYDNVTYDAVGLGKGSIVKATPIPDPNRTYYNKVTSAGKNLADINLKTSEVTFVNKNNTRLDVVGNIYFVKDDSADITAGFNAAKYYSAEELSSIAITKGEKFKYHFWPIKVFGDDGNLIEDYSNNYKPAAGEFEFWPENTNTPGGGGGFGGGGGSGGGGGGAGGNDGENKDDQNEEQNKEDQNNQGQGQDGDNKKGGDGTTPPADVDVNADGQGGLDIGGLTGGDGSDDWGNNGKLKNIRLSGFDVAAAIDALAYANVAEDAEGNVIIKSMVEGKEVLLALDRPQKIFLVKRHASFLDTVDHWAKNSIEFCAIRELVMGVGDGMYAPDATVTRAMPVVLLYRLENSPMLTANARYFPDVNEDWFKNAIYWAGGEKIVKGIGIKNFAPYWDITREQLAVMLYNYCVTRLGAEPVTVVDLSMYGDRENISEWAYEAVTYCYQTGLMRGQANTGFYPTRKATRAELATTMERLIYKMLHGEL